jgi:hypothetical protein
MISSFGCGRQPVMVLLDHDAFHVNLVAQFQSFTSPAPNPVLPAAHQLSIPRKTAD